jgi:membrane protease subunit (stomatin/prohibitin family)
MIMKKAIGRYNVKIKDEIINKMVWIGKDKNKYIIDDIGDGIYQVKKSNSKYYQYKVIGG